MKKIISRSLSVILALATLFTMLVTFTGCPRRRNIGKYYGQDVVVNIYIDDGDGSLYCRISEYHFGKYTYHSKEKKISDSNQIEKIALSCYDTSARKDLYVTITKIGDKKFGKTESKIQTDLYSKGTWNFTWIENRYDIPFYSA